MRNGETGEKGKVTPKKALAVLTTEKQDLTMELGKRLFCDAKKNAGNNRDKLTIEELRKFKGFDGISETETIEIIESLFQLAIVVYNLKE